jgi:hypothetical protein
VVVCASYSVRLNTGNSGSTLAAWIARTNSIRRVEVYSSSCVVIRLGPNPPRHSPRPTGLCPELPSSLRWCSGLFGNPLGDPLALTPPAPQVLEGPTRSWRPARLSLLKKKLTSPHRATVLRVCKTASVDAAALLCLRFNRNHHCRPGLTEFRSATAAQDELQGDWRRREGGGF